ncbi:MAG: protein NO VEIN domain-containing protein [Streptosporangiaceae bacterium]
MQPIADLLRKVLQTKGANGKLIRLKHLDDDVREELVRHVHKHALAYAGGDPADELADEWRPFKGVYKWWLGDGGLTKAEWGRLWRLRTDVNDELKARGMAKHLTENAKGSLYVRRAPQSPAGGDARPSPEEALAEVRGYTGVELTADEIRSLHEILTAPRKDTQILPHLRHAGHRLGDLKHLPEGENWWDKVHQDMLAADDDPYVEEPPGSREQHVAHDRNAVIFWLEHKILPALTGTAATGVTSGATSAEAQQEGTGTPASGASGRSGQGPLADAKKRRALEEYAMDAATAYYRARGWDVKRVSDTKKALDLRIVHRVSGEERRVEVKGSSQDASHVEVTRAEVAISREEACELFVLDKILYQDTGEGADDYTLEGGRRRADKWRADDEDLEPKAYDYHLGADFGEADA